MTPIDKTAPSQTESISFEFDLPHSLEKVWRAGRSHSASSTGSVSLERERGPRLERAGKMMGGKLVDLLGRIP